MGCGCSGYAQRREPAASCTDGLTAASVNPSQAQQGPPASADGRCLYRSQAPTCQETQPLMCSIFHVSYQTTKELQPILWVMARFLKT